jgi:hypothetical protein
VHFKYEQKTRVKEAMTNNDGFRSGLLAAGGWLLALRALFLDC